MINSFTFCLSLTLILFVSCSEDVSKHASIRRIINQTEHSIQIEVFGDNEIFTYQVEGMDTLNITGYCTSGIETYCVLGWASDLAFANIIFDSERIQKFENLPDDPTKKSINADPTGSDYGYSRSEENGIRIYTYIVSQEDYDNAEPISGQ